MSITAFPVLARIIHEKGIARTRLGTLTLAAGASDDALAWCLPRRRPVAARGHARHRGRHDRRRRRVHGRHAHGRTAPPGAARRSTAPAAGRMVTALAVLMLSAWTTDAIGIHAVFGAFVAGVAMPRGRFAEQLTANLSFMTTTFFVPVFFVYSGLNTRIGLLSSTGRCGGSPSSCSPSRSPAKGLRAWRRRVPRASRGATRSRSACS